MCRWAVSEVGLSSLLYLSSLVNQVQVKQLWYLKPEQVTDGSFIIMYGLIEIGKLGYNYGSKTKQD